jgi:hypothetical protein
MKFSGVVVTRVGAVASFASFDAEILRFAQDDKKAPPLHSGGWNHAAVRKPAKNDVAMRGKDLRSRCFFTVAQA